MGSPSAISSAIFWAVLCAAIVFGAFVAYAYLTTPSFATSAVVKLEAPKVALSGLPAPGEAGQRLRTAVLEPELFKELARLTGSDSAPARLQLANQVREGLTVSSKDGQTFTFSYLDSDAERAQKACNMVARRAAEVMPDVLLPPKRPEAPSPRAQKLEELLAFLAKHPELSTQQDAAKKAAEVGKPQPPVHEDALIQALNTERRAALVELKKLEEVDRSNPYADDVDAEVQRIRARLKEIDIGINARRKGLSASAKSAAPPVEVSATVHQKWEGLLQELKNQPEPKPASPEAAPKGVVLSEAAFPRWPVDPDRQLLLLIGSLAALVVAALGITSAMLGARRASQRSSSAPLAEERFDSGAPPAEVETRGAWEPGFGQAEPMQEAVAYPVEPALHQPVFTAVTALPEYREAPAIRGSAPVALGQSAVETKGPSTVRLGSDARAAEVVAKEQPHTALGGFGGSGPAVVAREPLDSMPRPISVRAMPATHTSEPAPPAPRRQPTPIEVQGVEVLQTPGEAALVAERSQSEAEVEANNPAPGERYRAPARKKTQMLGSPTWATAKPPSTPPEPRPEQRYSFVSTAPPEGGSEPVLKPAQGGGGHALAPYRQQRLPLVATQPTPAGWTLDTSLVTDALNRLCYSLSQHPRHGCLVIGVAGFAELSLEKSRVAAGIAVALGRKAQERVLLIEGDFQAPAAHRSMGIEMPIAAGLSQQLQARRAKERPAQLPWVVVECGPTLHVLGEGVIRSPGGILSQQYETCLREVGTAYDYIIVDGPAVTSEVECRAFAQLINGVVMTVPRAGSELPYEINVIFHGKEFIVSHPCL